MINSQKYRNIEKKKFQPIFICGHRKSGTTLLLNLLDDNGYISVYPKDLNLLYGYFPLFENSKISFKSKINRIKKVVFNDLRKDKFLKKKIDIDFFEKEFFKHIKKDNISINNIIYNLLKVYVLNFSKNNNKNKVLTKETSIEIYATEIKKWFKKAKFIHLIRDPRDNYASLKSGIKNYYSKFNDDENSSLFSLIQRSFLGLKISKINQSIIGPKDYLIIKYEDLVKRKYETLKKICNFLEIKFSNKLIKPTVLGKTTHGNNFNKLNMSKISNINVNKWKKRINIDEAKIIEFYLENEFTKFKYKTFFSKKEKALSSREFYKWLNYRYFYFDRFK